MVQTLEGRHDALELRIGLPSCMSYPAVTDLLARFRASDPQALLFLTEISAEEMSRKLNEGELDAGFLSLPTPARLMEGFESVTVWQAPYRVCISRSHPLAARSVLRAEDLGNLDFILAPRDYHRTHHDYQLAALGALGITPRIVHTDVSTTQSQMALTSAGVGACLLSPDSVALPGDLALLPTDPPLPAHALALFWSLANRNPLLKPFAARARRIAGRSGSAAPSL